MRGFGKTLAMLALAGGLAVVPAIGSQGAGALGETNTGVDSHLLAAADTAVPLRAADDLAQRRVAGLISRS